MKLNLRITADFDGVISAQIKEATNQDNPALVKALIVDDSSGIIHRIHIEYDSDADGNIYRRLNYEMLSISNGKSIFIVQNRQAQELLYKIAMALTGSTLTQEIDGVYTNRNFDKGMVILGPNDGTWDDVLPNDKPKTKAKSKKEAAK